MYAHDYFPNANIVTTIHGHQELLPDSYVKGVFISDSQKKEYELFYNTSFDYPVIYNPINFEQLIEVQIENIGEVGSYLVYDTYTELENDGEGYLSFDGQDDYVDLGSNLLSGNGDFSISLWVKSQATNGVIIQQRIKVILRTFH